MRQSDLKPAMHSWTTSAHSPWTFCSVCGMVRNDNNKPCRGRVHVAVRIRELDNGIA